MANCWWQEITSNDFLVARFNANGTLDTSFGSSGRITTDFAGGVDAAKGLVVQPDGKFVVTGHAWSGSSWDIALARYNADGTLDYDFWHRWSRADRCRQQHE
jgi:uncharacterized delta-60 repeat protein